MKDVKGKVAVVTGAASGIGRGMAESFAAAGMKLVLADVDADRLAQVAREIEKTDAEVLPVKTDVSRQVEVDELARRALDAFGAVHVVCNNAGVAHGGVPTWQSTLHDWEWIVGVNLMGVVHGVRTFTPLLLEQGEGHIVNTASMAGLISGGGNALYGVTKHAVVALSEALFNELAAQGPSRVRVSVLCPGWINTQILQSSQRNQPEAVRHHLPQDRTSPEAEIRRKLVESMLASGLDPRRVGDLVLDAIRAERFWILTHPQWKSMIRHRMENALEERDPTPAGPPSKRG
jgi:NAD(P)-dependent dehydrogenase (short-subunit alcohol dehydrogenase family)